MTASVSHKGKWTKAVKFALAATLSASVVAGSVAPAAANDWYYDEQNIGEQNIGEQNFDQHQIGSVGSRSVYRDDLGRYFIRNGRKQYIQYWDRPLTRDPVVKPRRDRNKNLETAIIAGVAGLAIGAIIAGSNQQPQRVVAPPRRVLPRNAFPDAPTVYEPKVITYDGAFEPWSQGWADWCSDRYRSFNVSTGTYKGYDGISRFCVVK